MSHDIESQPAPKRPYEQFGLTEHEHLYNRVSDERFRSILEDERTTVHEFQETSNSFGEFLFITTSRPGDKNRILMTFYGLGFHEHRERWITDEWFWYQNNPHPDLLRKRIEKEQAQELLQQRMDYISPELKKNTQTAYGALYEMLADLTDEDGALAEMEDAAEFLDWILVVFPPEDPPEPRASGAYLLDEESRNKLPALYSNEEFGLEAVAPVKFFTPDADWTWYASEFDGEDIFFGLVSGFEVELGYFSLKELQEVRGSLGLEIERDLHYEPKTLKELMEMHQRGREASNPDG